MQFQASAHPENLWRGACREAVESQLLIEPVACAGALATSTAGALPSLGLRHWHHGKGVEPCPRVVDALLHVPGVNHKLDACQNPAIQNTDEINYQRARV